MKNWKFLSLGLILVVADTLLGQTALTSLRGSVTDPSGELCRARRCCWTTRPPADT